MMSEYFGQHHQSDPFVLFSGIHVLTLLFIFFIGLGLFVCRLKLKKERVNRLFRYTLACVLIVSETSLHIWFIYLGEWSITGSLPLHLSSISVILALIMLINKNYLLFELTYFAGLGSAIQAMLTPDLGMYSFPHYRYVQFFISHGGVAIACLFMVFVEGFRPTLRSLWRTFTLLNMYVVFILILNSITGANYLYLSEKPTIPSILEYLGPWPWYILSMEIVALLTFLILYAPFAIKDFTKPVPD